MSSLTLALHNIALRYRSALLFFKHFPIRTSVWISFWLASVSQNSVGVSPRPANISSPFEFGENLSPSPHSCFIAL